MGLVEGLIKAVRAWEVPSVECVKFNTDSSFVL